jgi:hypothetical protein
MSQAYPLSWPAGWKRAHWRKSAPFRSGGVDMTIATARKRLADQLDLLRADNVILSTNVELRADGQPRSDRRTPDDPGVAVYFNLKGRKTVLACDKWDTVADNIAALAKHIDAMRGMDRWGVGTLEQAFTGYAALPAPDPWWEILGLSGPTRSAETIRKAWATASRDAHPDRPGGSHDKQARVNAARDEGLAAINQGN